MIAGIVALVLAVPATALAGEKAGDAGPDDAPAEEPAGLALGEVTSALPLVGAGLTVSVTVDDSGISEVALNSGEEPVKQSDHVAVFELDDDGTKVLVMAGKHGVRTSVRADSLDDVTGPGTWSGDVFGTGTVTVPYTIGVGSDGAPTIDVGSVSAPSGVTVEVGDIATKSHDGDRKSWAGARVEITLTSGDQKAVIVISVSSYERSDGTTAASVGVTVTDGKRMDLRHRGDCTFPWREGRWHRGDDRDGDASKGRFIRGGDDGRRDRDGRDRKGESTRWSRSG